MLRVGFLGVLSGFVSEQTGKNAVVLDRAARRFGLQKHLVHADDPEKVLGLFSEWLVFDYAQNLFNGRTGLEFFTEQNPLRLPKEEIDAYADMRSFEVGLFEVKKVERGKGIALVSFGSCEERFVHDVNASLSLCGNETIWARIAPIRGLYHGVGSIFLIMPMRFKTGMREVAAKWKKNSFDAREAASWTANHPECEQRATPSYEVSLRTFKNALVKCGMDGFFSIETYTQWVSDETKYDMDFAPRALDCLIPDTAVFKDTAELIRAAAEFANNIPRKSLQGKTPNEVVRERKKGEVGDWETDLFSKEKYLTVLKQASEYMARGEFEKSFKAFEQVVRDLLKDKLPFFHVFRIYANAAVCCFHKGDEILGEALLDASLRINPLYDFAVRQKERYVLTRDSTRTAGFRSLQKKGQKVIRGVQSDMRKTGERMYQHRVFSKYERFLKELGVSLVHQSKTVPAVYSFDTDGKPVKNTENWPQRPLSMWKR